MHRERIRQEANITAGTRRTQRKAREILRSAQDDDACRIARELGESSISERLSRLSTGKIVLLQLAGLCYEKLITGLGGGFGAGLEEFFYFLDVSGDVNAYGVVRRFDHVDAEAVF